MCSGAKAERLRQGEKAKKRKRRRRRRRRRRKEGVWELHFPTKPTLKKKRPDCVFLNRKKKKNSSKVF